MINSYRFHAEQNEHCQDLLREAARARLIQEALTNRRHQSIFYLLIQLFSSLIRK